LTFHTVNYGVINFNVVSFNFTCPSFPVHTWSHNRPGVYRKLGFCGSGRLRSPPCRFLNPIRTHPPNRVRPLYLPSRRDCQSGLPLFGVWVLIVQTFADGSMVAMLVSNKWIEKAAHGALGQAERQVHVSRMPSASRAAFPVSPRTCLSAERQHTLQLAIPREVADVLRAGYEQLLFKSGQRFRDGFVLRLIGFCIAQL